MGLNDCNNLMKKLSNKNKFIKNGFINGFINKRHFLQATY